MINKIINKMNSESINNVEIYCEKAMKLWINIFNGEIETYNSANETGINISGNYKGNYGSTYIEKIDDNSIQEATENIKNTASNNKKVFKTSKINKINSIKKNEYKNNQVDIEHIINKLKDIEKYALSLDNRIKQVSKCSVYCQKTEIQINNEEGIELIDKYKYVTACVSVIAEVNNLKQDGFAYGISENFEEIDYETLVLHAVKDAVSMINSSPVNTGSYSVVLRNNVAANIFSNFMPIWGGNSVQKNISAMNGKEGKQVASQILTIVEDPFAYGGKMKRTFDDEGTALCRKYIIKDGILENIFYDNNSALALGKTSTGNGFRKSYKENPSVCTTNCYIQKGTKETVDIIKNMVNGLFITDIDGLHAGVNTVTGEFSLLAKGYSIKNGMVEKAVNQITVAGNIYDLIQNIEDISCDTMPSEEYFNLFISPSLHIKSLMIGGL